jgi:Glycosyltransferase family 92
VRGALHNPSLAAAWGKGLWWQLPIHRDPPHFLAVCAVFKDEARYLPEWVTFHRMMGVERFYLYDNGSEDDWRGALAPDLEDGVIEVIDWPVPPVQAQLSAYRHCLEHRRTDARWIAFIDIDEFLFAPDGRSLVEVLRGFAQYPGVVAGWRVYGTSGLRNPPDGLVIESYLMRAGEEHFRNAYGKSIVQARRTLASVESPHVFRHYAPGRFWRLAPPRDESGLAYQEPRFDSSGPLPGQCSKAEILRINHYYTRSEAEARSKWQRTAVTYEVKPPLAVLLDPSLNEVHDDTIVRFAPQLRRRLAARRTATLSRGDG